MNLKLFPVELVEVIYSFCVFIPKNNQELYKAVDEWKNEEFSEKYGDISLWDTRYITDMSYLFSDSNYYLENCGNSILFMDKNQQLYKETLETSAGHTRSNNTDWIYHKNNYKRERNKNFKFNNFNEDISYWNVSNVINMEYMFENAKSFNRNLSRWNVSNVKNMNWMFLNATEFNQDLNDWDVGNVETMIGMFSGAKKFNNGCNWNMNNVKNTSYMFHKAFRFNQNIGIWDVSNVEHMHSMFDQAISFNGDIRNWNVIKVKDISYMFAGARNFLHILDKWKLLSLIKDIRYGAYKDIIVYTRRTDNELIGKSLDRILS